MVGIGYFYGRLVSGRFLKKGFNMSDQVFIVPSNLEVSLGISQSQALPVKYYWNEFKLIGDGRKVSSKNKKYYKYAIIGYFTFCNVTCNFKVLKKSNKPITGNMLQKYLDKNLTDRGMVCRETFAAVNVRDEIQAAVLKGAK